MFWDVHVRVRARDTYATGLCSVSVRYRIGLILRLIWIEITLKASTVTCKSRTKNETRTERTFVTFSFLFLQKQTTTRGSPQPLQLASYPLSWLFHSNRSTIQALASMKVMARACITCAAWWSPRKVQSDVTVWTASLPLIPHQAMNTLLFLWMITTLST